MKKARIAVLVSGGGTNLQALIDAQKAGIIKSGKICLVASDKPEAYALKRAGTADIPTVVVDRGEFSSPEDFEDSLCAVLEKWKIELVVLAGFMRILSDTFTRRWDKRMINVHPSLIPSFCGRGYYGLGVHKAALDRGVKITGATVHYVNEIPDGGEIILQKAVDVLPGDTPESLQRRVMEQAEWVILPLACELTSQKIAEGGKGE